MQKLKPLFRMWERVEVGRTDSDTTLFHDLMYAGEMMAKTIVAALVAAIGDDKDRSRYRQVSRLVRADGIGEWASVLAEVLTGPPSQHLLVEARTEQRELTQKVGSEAWQYQAAQMLHYCVALDDPSHDPLPTKVDGLYAIRALARLRNKTRGHGAQPTKVLGKICPQLERALRLIVDNHSLFKREWAYIHRNLSGKYRVTKLSEHATAFEPLKQDKKRTALPNGVYVFLGQYIRVELAHSDVDASDFYLANGAFNEKRFEMLSYATGDRIFSEAGPYLDPTTPLPGSETEGLKELDSIGHCLSNIPALPSDYVRRESLERELLEILKNDRHPVITLHT